MFRDIISNGHAVEIEPVETPLGPTFVRTISAGEKDDYDVNAAKDGRFRCRLVMLCCCDERGNREFTNEDLPALDALPFYLVEPIIDAALKINRMSRKDAEEIRKNSRSQGPDSRSD